MTAKECVCLRRPRGFIAVVAIVCLMVAAVIFLMLLRTVAAQRSSLQTAAWRIQASWLSESGLERAVSRLTRDRGYQGETWTIAPEEIDARNSAVVRIAVEPVAGRPNHRLVRVQADFPDDPTDRARQTKETVVLVPTSQ